MKIGIITGIIIIVIVCHYWVLPLVKSLQARSRKIKLKNDIEDQIQNIKHYINTKRVDMYSSENLALLLESENICKENSLKLDILRKDVLVNAEIAKKEIYLEIENMPSRANPFFDPTLGMIDEMDQSMGKAYANARLNIHKAVTDCRIALIDYQNKSAFEKKVFDSLKDEVKTSIEMKNYVLKLVEVSSVYIRLITPDKFSEFFYYKLLIIERVKIILDALDSELAISFKNDTHHLFELNKS
ncbi:MAG: hypothetical protein NTX85_00255 [Candidatus Nomurabacteria bacterium]|nr:hypothetical protein [Candidatus Nomurabacteria bacterium]